MTPRRLYAGRGLLPSGMFLNLCICYKSSRLMHPQIQMFFPFDEPYTTLRPTLSSLSHAFTSYDIHLIREEAFKLRHQSGGRDDGLISSLCHF